MKIEGFEWDEGNKKKNWERHQVTVRECEEAFFNKPLVVLKDEKHSQKEIRYIALGQTNQIRRLYIVFTIRKSLIRVVSARNQSKKERNLYEIEAKKT